MQFLAHKKKKTTQSLCQVFNISKDQKKKGGAVPLHAIKALGGEEL